MLELGKKQVLYVVKKTPMGLFLNEDPEELLNSLTLSKKETEELEDLELGDKVEVYCYMNHDEKIIATLQAPIVCNGEIGVLEVVESNQYGAFLNWGYEKDILLPFSEQFDPVTKGDKLMIGIYTDKSGRVCATQKLKKVLSADHQYKLDDIVYGTIYSMTDDIGAFVAIDNKYFGLILSNEVLPSMKRGMEVTGRVTKVRDDGKMNMTLNKRIDLQMDEDSLVIYAALEEHGGFLPYHDKSDSQAIKRTFNMSKKAFKRAIGKLYKEKKIQIELDGLHLIEGNDVEDPFDRDED